MLPEEQDADPPWAMPANNTFPMAEARPNHRPKTDPPPPIGWKHIQRTAAPTWTMESLHGLRKHKPNQHYRPRHLIARHHGTTQKPAIAKNTEPNGHNNAAQLLRSSNTNPPTSQQTTKPTEQMTRPKKTMTPQDHGPTTTTSDRHETGHDDPSLADNTKSHQPLPRKSIRTPATTTQESMTQPTATNQTDTSRARTRHQTSCLPPPKGVIRQLEQALQRVTAAMKMTLPPPNRTTRHSHKTSENSVFHPKPRPEAIANQTKHHPPTMQVHSKPSAGRRPNRSANTTALGPIPLVTTKLPNNITAITPDRPNKNKENQKTNKNNTENKSTTTHNTDENTQTNQNHYKTLDNKQEQENNVHNNKETQPTTNKTNNHNDAADSDDKNPPNNNDQGTPRANPYLQPKGETKRPPSPEPKTLIHLHVAINHHPNPQVESTLPRLTEQALKTHFNEVFFHHSKREEPMWLQVHSVDFLETKQSGTRSFRHNNQHGSHKGGGHTSTFHVTLSPAPANDVFDSEIFIEQGLRFVLQMWHKHHNDDFVYDEFDSQTVLPPGTKQSNPTINPRFDQINVYHPACNNRKSDTFGIIVGVPAQTIKHRRAALDLTSDIQNTLTPHLPRKLHYMDLFNHIGCRTGTFSGELKNKQKGQVPAIYVTASTRNNFEALLRSYKAYMAANRNSEMKWNKNNIQLIPMPTSQPNRTATLEAIKDIDQFFSACVRIKLKPINPEATDGDWKQLRQLREFVAVFPEYNNEDPDAQYYTLYLRKTPDTHMLTTNTIRQFTDFPTNILLPTLAAVTASPPRQPTNNQDPTTPTSSSHTNRLVAFTGANTTT